MRACLMLWIVLAQTLNFSASQDLRYIQRFEGESVDIFCVAQASTSHPMILNLKRFADSERVIHFSEDDEVRADLETEGRIKISGQLKLRRVTMTISQLKHTDTGLYVCDFSGNSSDQLSRNTAVFLHVRTSGEPCSCRRFSQLIYSLSAGVSLCVLTVAILFVIHHKQTHAQKKNPIYEDMTSVQRMEAAQTAIGTNVLKTIS